MRFAVFQSCCQFQTNWIEIVWKPFVYIYIVFFHLCEKTCVTDFGECVIFYTNIIIIIIYIIIIIIEKLLVFTCIYS